MLCCASKFDKWLAEEAEKKGALLVSNVQVTELITEGEGKNRRVVGVRCHDDEVYAKLVIIAEGANTVLLEEAGLTGPTDPKTMAVGVKEVYKLKKRTSKIALCYLVTKEWLGSPWGT